MRTNMFLDSSADGENEARPEAKRNLEIDSAISALALPPPSTPRNFEDFLGQKRAIQRIAVLIESSKNRSGACPHFVLVGDRGSGKATLGICAANSRGSTVLAITAPKINSVKDLMGLVTSLEENGVLVIEDIDKLKRAVIHPLIVCLKLFSIECQIDEGPNARSVRLTLPKFTCVGTAVRRDLVDPGLLDCFSTLISMEPYSATELSGLTEKWGAELGVRLEADAALAIVKEARSSPKEIWRLLSLVRDYTAAKAINNAFVDAGTTLAALELFRPDPDDSPIYDRQAISSAVRREVWNRDGGKCSNCGSRERLEYDHIIPVSQGGSNTVRNIELLCESCNRSKSDSIE